MIFITIASSQINHLCRCQILKFCKVMNKVSIVKNSVVYCIKICFFLSSKKIKKNQQIIENTSQHTFPFNYSFDFNFKKEKFLAGVHFPFEIAYFSNSYFKAFNFLSFTKEVCPNILTTEKTIKV